MEASDSRHALRAQVVALRFRCIALAIGVSLLLATQGCASLKNTFYSFAFDMDADDQDAVVLDYRYTLNGQTIVGASKDVLREGLPFHRESVFGQMPRGDALYFKWKIRSTNSIFEKTVDLRGRLPADLSKDRIFVMVRGSELLIYLIHDELRSPEAPEIGPRTFHSYRTELIARQM